MPNKFSALGGNKSIVSVVCKKRGHSYPPLSVGVSPNSVHSPTDMSRELRTVTTAARARPHLDFTILCVWRLLPVGVDVVADLLQEAEDLTQRGPEHVHRHQAAVPRRHGCLHQHLLDVGNRRTPMLKVLMS
ncbi:unnamed protein product [Menidia menidia]|uniref:(Atlantic silverside) hypothetical protein n=1 Tax=Menidia menidia TaxID=238744 RepID=A0A8S4BQB7_9TELE|nr:unnamed protein product [Menidia menidia]